MYRDGFNVPYLELDGRGKQAIASLALAQPARPAERGGPIRSLPWLGLSQAPSVRHGNPLGLPTTSIQPVTSMMSSQERRQSPAPGRDTSFGFTSPPGPPSRRASEVSSLGGASPSASRKPRAGRNRLRDYYGLNPQKGDPMNVGTSAVTPPAAAGYVADNPPPQIRLTSSLNLTSTISQTMRHCLTCCRGKTSCSQVASAPPAAFRRARSSR